MHEIHVPQSLGTRLLIYPPAAPQGELLKEPDGLAPPHTNKGEPDMPDDTTDPNSLEASALQITLDPESITIDESGRISLKNAKTMSAIMAARPVGTGASLRDDQNLAICGGNGYQCACK